MFFVGTLEEANAFIASANKTGGNTTVTSLPLIPYNDYKALEDKETHVTEICGVEEAKQVIQDALDLYQSIFFR